MKYRDILNSFSLNELDAKNTTKDAIRIMAEYIITQNASFSTAIRLASILLENEKIKPTKEFENQHPENKMEVYSSPEIFLSFFLLMIAQKAENLFHIQKELETGICYHISVICRHGQESCSMCLENEKEMEMKDASFDTIPPYHVGCTCGMIIKK